MSKNAKPAKWPKSDVRHWRTKVFQRTGADYTVQIGFAGQQKRIPLKTANATEAAAKARDIYKFLHLHGWEKTLEEFKPWTVEETTPADALTVGQFIESARAVADVRPNTFLTYERKFRFLVAELQSIKSSKAKHDYMSGGHQIFRDAVNAVALSRLTPEAIEAWRLSYIKRRGKTPVDRNHAKSTSASIIRNAKSLFSKKILKGLKSIALPDPLPFDDVSPGKQPRARYKSKIDIGALAAAARTDLEKEHPEQYKIFLLGACAGLRRSEMDSLLWKQFDWRTNRLNIEANEYGTTKTDASADVIDLGPDVAALFKGWFEQSKTKFVLSSAVDPNPSSHWNHYRAEGHYKKLILWLRSKGVDDQKPLHTLRKEFGSLVNQQFGIFAASAALRHSNIGVTRDHYADSRERYSIDLSQLGEAS